MPLEIDTRKNIKQSAKATDENETGIEKFTETV